MREGRQARQALPGTGPPAGQRWGSGVLRWGKAESRQRAAVRRLDVSLIKENPVQGKK